MALGDRARKHVVAVHIHQTGHKIAALGATFAFGLAGGTSAKIVRSEWHDGGNDERSKRCDDERRELHANE